MNFIQDLAVIGAIGSAILTDEETYLAGQQVTTQPIKVGNVGTLTLSFQKATSPQPLNIINEFITLLSGAANKTYTLAPFTETVGKQLLLFSATFQA